MTGSLITVKILEAHNKFNALLNKTYHSDRIILMVEMKHRIDVRLNGNGHRLFRNRSESKDRKNKVFDHDAGLSRVKCSAANLYFLSSMEREKEKV